MSKREGQRKGIRPVTMEEYLAERGIDFGRPCKLPKTTPHDLHSERIPSFNSEYLFLFHQKRKSQVYQQEMIQRNQTTQSQQTPQIKEKEVRRRSQRNSHESSEFHHLKEEQINRKLRNDLVKSEKERARLLEQVKMMAQALQELEGENRGISALNVRLEDKLKDFSIQFQRQKEKESEIQIELRQEKQKTKDLQQKLREKEGQQEELEKVIELNRKMAEELDKIEEILEERESEISQLKQKLEETPNLKPKTDICKFCLATNDPCLGSGILDHIQTEKCTCHELSNNQIQQINLLPSSFLLSPPHPKKEINLNRSGEEAVERLKRRIEELEDEMMRLSGKKKKLQDSLFRERDNVGLIKQEAETMAVENNKLEQECLELKKMIRVLEERESERVKGQKKVEEELASFMEINTSKDAEIRKLEENITFLEPQIEEIQNEKQNLYEENQELQHQIEKLEKETGEKKNQLLVLEERLWKSDKNCQNLITQNEKLAGNLNIQLEEVDRMKVQSKNHDRDLLTWKVGRFLLGTEISRRIHEIESLSAREKSLKIQLEHQKEENQNILTKTQKLDQELKEAQANLKSLKKIREQEKEEYERHRNSLKSIPPTSCYNSSKHLKKNENRKSLESIQDKRKSQNSKDQKDSANLAADLLMQRLEQLNGDFKRLEEKVTSEIIGRQRHRESVERYSCSRRSRNSSRVPLSNRQISHFDDSHQKSVHLKSSNSKMIYHPEKNIMDENVTGQYVGNGVIEDSVLQIQKQMGMIGHIKSQNKCKTETCPYKGKIISKIIIFLEVIKIIYIFHIEEIITKES